ncbi:hypothetical protein C8Q70DRAFT_1053402 [Cubamyces menziesii]|nr:hypothetical protein C8Q70DRAFT_1053402 [Cubamyces menziesii]
MPLEKTPPSGPWRHAAPEALARSDKLAPQGSRVRYAIHSGRASCRYSYLAFAQSCAPASTLAPRVVMAFPCPAAPPSAMLLVPQHHPSCASEMNAFSARNEALGEPDSPFSAAALPDA